MSTNLGLCVQQFSGHTNLVTQFSLGKLVNPTNAPGIDGSADTDVIASVSDDGTVRVFHFKAQNLIT